MSRGILDFRKRYRGKTIEHDFKEAPRCKYCGRKMKIQARSKPHHVAGKEENYDIIKVYRRCGNRDCPGYLEKPISPPDTIALTGFGIDLDLQAEICEMRFKDNRTAKEIVKHLKEEHGVSTSESRIGNILKRYEIGCSQKYKPEAVEKLKASGGIMFTIDAMEPLKGEPAVYTARDEITNITLGAKQLPNKKVATIEKLRLLRTRRHARAASCHCSPSSRQAYFIGDTARPRQVRCLELKSQVIIMFFVVSTKTK